jgi:hypothetical protein
MSQFARKHDVGFIFSSKDRVELTRRSIESIDVCPGFDLIWLDGSSDQAAREFAASYAPRRMHIAGRFFDVGGGPDAVIVNGLKLLSRQGYAWCGMIENDIEFEPGWFAALMKLFDRGRELGLSVGAAGVRTLDSRVLAYGSDFALMWDIGAGMILFARCAMEIVLANYAVTESQILARFYQRRFGVDLSDRWEIWQGYPNLQLSTDFNYCPQLYRHNFACLGSVPSLAKNIDVDLESLLRTSYAQHSKPSPHLNRILEQLREAAQL